MQVQDPHHFVLSRQQCLAPQLDVSATAANSPNTSNPPSIAPKPLACEGPIVVAPPFDDPTADVILRSSDHVDFHVFKAILSQASPIFRSMFTLPQKPPAGTMAPFVGALDEKGGIPVVQMTEDQEALELMLRICYPVALPSLSDLRVIRIALEVGRKFDLDRALEMAERELLQFTSAEPVLTYVLACQYGFIDAARKAAACSLRLPFETLLRHDEFDEICSRATRHLLIYHEECKKVALGCVHDPNDFWYQNHESGCTGPSRVEMKGLRGTRKIEPWCKAFAEDLVDALRLQGRQWEDVVTTENAFTCFNKDRASGCESCRQHAVEVIQHLVGNLTQNIRRKQSEIILDISSIA